jgi:hypothetical protein
LNSCKIFWFLSFFIADNEARRGKVITDLSRGLVCGRSGAGLGQVCGRSGAGLGQVWGRSGAGLRQVWGSYRKHFEIIWINHINNLLVTPNEAENIKTFVLFKIQIEGCVNAK